MPLPRSALLFFLLLVSGAHCQEFEFPLDSKGIGDFWLSMCDSSVRPAKCCSAWNYLVNAAISHMNDFWVPELKPNLPKIRMLDEYEPFWNCITRERVPSRKGDGPKWACGLDTMDSSALVYSFGSNGNSLFEQGTTKRLNNRKNIFVFDPFVRDSKVEKVRKEGFQIFQIGLSGSKNSTINKNIPGSKQLATLQEHMALLGHTSRRIEILKVDIEGWEYESFKGVKLGDFPGADVSVGQFLVEVHLSLKTAELDATALNMYVKRFFHSLYSSGMFLFSKERNHWGCRGYSCVEFSFVGPQLAFKDFLLANPMCV